MTDAPPGGASEGTLLGGRVAYRQPVDGYRTGIEPVLLAAAIPASPGARVAEAGTGAGAGLLCLAARVPGVVGLGIERDPALADLARANFAANGHDALLVLTGDVAAWRSDVQWDHAMANPPWHDPAGTASAMAGRRAAKQAGPGGLERWCTALSRKLRRRGTLTLILPAAALARGITALLGAGCAESVLMPLWPRAGQPAKLVILQGVRDGKGGCRVLPGLVLHEPDGAYTGAAERILRHAADLPIQAGQSAQLVAMTQMPKPLMRGDETFE